jgi:hypothetical protein
VVTHSGGTASNTSRGLDGNSIVDSLPESALITEPAKAPDMIWIWQVSELC